jgi:hypothetical protein
VEGYEDLRYHTVKAEGQPDEADAAHTWNARYLRNVVRVCEGIWKDFILKNGLKFQLRDSYSRELP